MPSGLTPRVRTLLICDGIRPSKTEENVFHLRGARSHVFAELDPSPLFPDAGDLLPLDVPVHVRFPREGRYTMQLWFFQETTADILKMEQPFYILAREG